MKELIQTKDQRIAELERAMDKLDRDWAERCSIAMRLRDAAVLKQRDAEAALAEAREALTKVHNYLIKNPPGFHTGIEYYNILETIHAARKAGQ